MICVDEVVGFPNWRVPLKKHRFPKGWTAVMPLKFIPFLHPRKKRCSHVTLGCFLSKFVLGGLEPFDVIKTPTSIGSCLEAHQIRTIFGLFSFVGIQKSMYLLILSRDWLFCSILIQIHSSWPPFAKHCMCSWDHEDSDSLEWSCPCQKRFFLGGDPCSKVCMYSIC